MKTVIISILAALCIAEAICFQIYRANTKKARVTELLKVRAVLFEDIADALTRGENGMSEIYDALELVKDSEVAVLMQPPKKIQPWKGITQDQLITLRIRELSAQYDYDRAVMQSTLNTANHEVEVTKRQLLCEKSNNSNMVQKIVTSLKTRPNSAHIKGTITQVGKDWILVNCPPPANSQEWATIGNPVRIGSDMLHFGRCRVHGPKIDTSHLTEGQEVDLLGTNAEVYPYETVLNATTVTLDYEAN